jgi:hypothetical protein
MEFSWHHVDTDVRDKDLSVVYTDDPITVENSIDTMEQLFANDKYTVVGFTIQYTDGRPAHD